MYGRTFLATAAMLLAASLSCRSAAPPPAPPAHPAAKPAPLPNAQPKLATRTGKEDCEELMNFVLPFAQKMLRERRAFFPFAATMRPTGVIDGTMVGDPEKMEIQQLIFMLELALRQGASEGKYKATALVVDMVVIPPGKSAKQDGVAIRLDHRDGYSVIVGFPYSFSDKGELLMEAPFANAGAHQIFPVQKE